MSEIKRLTKEELLEKMNTAPVKPVADENLDFDVEPRPFLVTGETMYATTKQLEKVIASFLGEIYSDLKLVSIGLNDGSNRAIPNTIPYGEFYVNLYFSPTNSEQKYRAVIDVINNTEIVTGKVPVLPYKSVCPIGGNHDNFIRDRKAAQILDGVRRLSGQMRRTTMYTIDGNTRKGLAQFAFENNNINWNLHITEYEDGSNVYSNNKEYYVIVMGLSLGKFIDKIYGSKDDNGVPIDYRISLFKNMAAGFYPGNRNYIVAIHRLSRASVSKLAEMANMYPGQGVILGTRVERNV